MQQAVSELYFYFKLSANGFQHFTVLLYKGLEWRGSQTEVKTNSIQDRQWFYILNMLNLNCWVNESKAKKISSGTVGHTSQIMWEIVGKWTINH